MKVLIALDESECSKQALESALQRCWKSDTEFKLVKVVELPIPPYAYPEAYMMESLLQAHRQHIKDSKSYVEEMVQLTKAAQPTVQVTGEVVEGEVVGSLVELCKDWKADLLVLGSHGRRGLEKLVLGSVAQTMVNCAPCNVEIVKSRAADPKSHKECAGTCSKK